MYATVEWIGEDLFSVISLSTITDPRRPFDEYRLTDIVKAKYQGKIYEARIAELSGK